MKPYKYKGIEVELFYTQVDFKGYKVDGFRAICKHPYQFNISQRTKSALYYFIKKEIDDRIQGNTKNFN